jgi:hypothetical protein
VGRADAAASLRKLLFEKVSRAVISSARKLAAWCAEVERMHQAVEGECIWCSEGSMTKVAAFWPCHAIQGARAVRAAMDYVFAKVAASRVHSDAWCVAGDVLELLAAALEVGRKFRQSRPGISGCRNRAWRRA